MYAMTNPRTIAATSKRGLPFAGTYAGAENRLASLRPGNAPRAQTFCPGKVIFSEGDEAEFFFEIVSGTVRCCSLTVDGRRQIYRFAGAGEILGLGGDALHGYSAEAVTEVSVRRHRLSSLDTAMANDGRLRERVVQALRDKLSAVRTQMMLLGRMSAAERIASFLRTLSERATGADGCIRRSTKAVTISAFPVKSSAPPTIAAPAPTRTRPRR